MGAEEDETADETVSGDDIRLVWHYTVVVPLGDAEGFLPNDPRWLRQARGLIASLIEDVRLAPDLPRAHCSLRTSLREHQLVVERGHHPPVSVDFSAESVKVKVQHRVHRTLHLPRCSF